MEMSNKPHRSLPCSLPPNEPSQAPVCPRAPVATTATSLPGPSLHLESVIRDCHPRHFAPNL